jgi:hypothetical protein
MASATTIRFGFHVDDRFPHCRNCGAVPPRPFRPQGNGRWFDEDGVAFASIGECRRCDVAGRFRLADVRYADGLFEGVEPRTIRWAGNRYIVVLASVRKIGRDTPRLYVFFQEQGGTTKGEALFWAERAASKNGFPLLIPEAFEGVEARLP